MKSFFAGLGIGALIGLAVAPKAGAETRRELLDAANERFTDLRDEYEPRLDELKDELNERFDSIRGQVNEATDQLSDAKDRAIRTVTREYGNIINGGLMAILNEWPEERLIEIHGIGPVLASKIIQNRPYRQESDLTEAKILPPSAIDALRKAA